MLNNQNNINLIDYNFTLISCLSESLDRESKRLKENISKKIKQE